MSDLFVGMIFFHNGQELHSMTGTVDEMNKLIGILHYGGWKKDGVKYVVDDYYLVQFSPLQVHVNMQTEDELTAKTMKQLQNQIAATDPGFRERLTPVFQRREKKDLN